ncbi:tRNA (cytidine(34)-2'-O)-methyltransferase [Saccharopolyspora sp. HNM0983]|uniref:Putative tRNA (cytidine(34)-2'-O)-methyltransferase n=1 Tax=Saccharopolyspora montiporae TaxID=2781240 RepID=A0A929G0B4_9PSEU|nr:tRNA (cytidine(34)-2'-O)-methyltransferase [Saccharopolyspora sp. HNM0983]
MFHVVFHEPEIPGNAGNAIRMAAGSGCALHLVEPLGFSVGDAKLRRAGLDYHDRAALHVHPALDPLLDELAPHRIVAFTAHAERTHAQLRYAPGDVLLFGRESVGLPAEVLDRATDRVRIPMLPGIRSMNLANSAAVAVYEAWRQNDFGHG